MQLFRSGSNDNLRIKCFIIGYLHLITSLVDIACLLLIVAIISNGFQCDSDPEKLQLINWQWLEPILLFLNIGTHGFYPFPIFMRAYQERLAEDFMPLQSEPNCYPGMLHVHLVDILNFMINVIWFKFVLTYVSGLHRKDVERMRMFQGVCYFKLLMQIFYFALLPYNNIFYVNGMWFYKVLDILMSAIFLYIIVKYLKQVQLEKTQSVQESDLPPTYIECLIKGAKQQIDEKAAVTKTEEKKESIVNIQKPDEPA